MKRTIILQSIISIISLLMSFLMALYACSRFPAYTIIILSFWIILWFRYEIKPNNNHIGIFLVMVDIIYTVLFGGLLAYLFDNYQQLYALLPSDWQKFVRGVIGILHNFVPDLLLNLLFIACAVYALTLFSLRIIIINTINENKFTHPIFHYVFKIGYTQKDTAWLLMPRFLSIRPVAYLFLALGIFILGWYFWLADEPLSSIELIIWLGFSLIFIGMDWRFWLSGKVLEVEAFIDETKNNKETSVNEQSFEELWRQYHQFWKDKWLVAGNKSTGGK